jgi:hypothetical protein
VKRQRNSRKKRERMTGDAIVSKLLSRMRLNKRWKNARCKEDSAECGRLMNPPRIRSYVNEDLKAVVRV